MAQRTHGIYAVLSPAWMYQQFQNSLGARSLRRRFVDDHVKAVEGDRLLDIGCGTGDILDVLPRVRYVGCDFSSEYIQAARGKYGDRGVFHVGDVRDLDVDPAEKFKIVLAVGLLHHLDDEEAMKLFESGQRILLPGGRMVTIDPTFADGQHPIARLLAKLDRGLNVRTEREMLSLAKKRRFQKVNVVVRHDLLRIPYSHVILECHG